MPIDGGKSVLHTMGDAINQNLHEHFKMARRANMHTSFPDDPGSGPGGSHEGDEHRVGLVHPSSGAEYHIGHNRKTGEVKGSSNIAWGYPNTPHISDPKEARADLNKTKKESIQEIRNAEGYRGPWKDLNKNTRGSQE